MEARFMDDRSLYATIADFVGCTETTIRRRFAEILTKSPSLTHCSV